ncbi:MAG: glycosyltransferase family 2 protein [Actinomycetes bacterium]
MTPDLSVVISTHSRPAMVRQAVAAIRAQSWSGPIETIVVYDQSEPDTSLESTDALRPVRVVRNHRRAGLPGSRNAGAEVASAPVLGFCDDDDLWLPEKAARQLELLERTGAEASTTGIEILVGELVVERRGESEELTFERLLQRRMIEANMVTAVVGASAFWDLIGPLDEALPGGYAEDYEWVLRAARRQPLAVAPEPLVQVRWSAASHFRDRWLTIDRALGYLVSKFPEFGDDARGWARVQGQRAFARAAAGRRRSALHAAASSLRRRPVEPRAWLALAVASGAVPSERVVDELRRRGRGL